MFIIVAGANFYRFSTSTTDENLFRAPPSHLYVTTSFPTLNQSRASHPSNPNAAIDSVKIGDILFSVDHQRVKTVAQFEKITHPLPHDSEITFGILRISEGERYNFLVRKSALPDSFLTDLPNCVLVYHVTPGGASDLADLRVGDLIYRINGEAFSTTNEADFILRGVESGKTILYDVIRNNKKIVVPVTLAKFGLQLAVFSFFLVGLVYWGTGAFIALSKPHILAARLLGLGFMCFGFFMMVLLAQRDVVFDVFAKLRTVMALGAFLFGFVLWGHSKYYFPLEQPQIQTRRGQTLAPYLMATGFLLVFVAMIYLNVDSKLAVRIVFWSAGALILGYSFLFDLIYRKQRSTQYKKIKRPLGWLSFSACILAAVTGYLIISTGEPRQFGLIGFYFLIIPVAYLYSIARFQLLEMKLRVRKNVQYSIASTLWVIAMSSVLVKLLLALPSLDLNIPNIQFTGTSFVVLDIPPDPRLHDFWEKLLIMVFALGLALVFWRLGKMGQGVLERLFNRRAYDINRATSELAEVMATKLGMKELARGVVEKLAKLMQLKRIGIMFFRDQKSCCCQEAHGFDGTEWEVFCVTVSDKLIHEIQKFRSESRFSIDYLPYGIKEDLLREGFRHLIPIRFKDKLVGTFIIGEKLSESPLHLEDLSFLAAVAKQASIAIENAFLHEELTEQERLKHELKIARRIQMASLPQTTPQVDGLEIAGISIPALEVGGDYFDYLNGVSAGVTVIVGDVSGKGTSAALYMSKVQGIIRSLHGFNLSPGELFVRANQLLFQDLEKKSFITAIGAFIDPGKRKLVLARAGHLPLFYFSFVAKEVSLLTPRGLGLGLDGAEVFASELEESEISYQAGDVFLLVTDGVTEAQTAAGGEFGEDKLIEVLSANAALDANNIRDRVLAEVRYFLDDELPHDDQTVVVVKAL